MLAFSAIIADYSNNSKVSAKKWTTSLTVFFFSLTGLGLIFTSYANTKVYHSQSLVKKTYDAISRKNNNKIIEYTTKAYNPFFTLDYFSTPLLRHRGTSYLLLKQNDKAIKDLLKALDDHPYNVSTINNIAAYFAQQEDYSKAVHYYKNTLLFYPNYEFGIKNLARAYYLNKEYTKAYLTILKYSTKEQDQKYLAFINELKDNIN